MARHTHRQQGQILVLGMLLVAVVGIAWLRYFSTGQVTAAKSRLLNGLDAAAYSGALVQARTLNFLAYLNRAQLAHQLAMAHLVTLGSWAQFAGTQAERLARGNPPAHLIGLMFGADHGRAYLAASAATGMGAQAGPAGTLTVAHAAHNDFVHNSFLALSSALVDGLPDARLAAMRAVLAEHYPERRSVPRPVITEDAWPELLKRRPADLPLFEFVRALAKAYPFLGPRNHTARNPWSVDARCPALRHELRRRGGTALNESGRWQAGDTQSYHALRSNRWIGCYFREYAMGWAWMPAQAGQAMDDDYVDDAPDNFSQQDFWRWVREATRWSLLDGRSNPLANSYAMRDRREWASGGLAAYYDVAPEKRGDAVTGFVVQLQGLTAEGVPLRARSAAETYFARPHARADGRNEHPNAFHPYWHARLAPSLAAFPEAP